jgi:hypothetical protein
MMLGDARYVLHIYPKKYETALNLKSMGALHANIMKRGTPDTRKAFFSSPKPGNSMRLNPANSLLTYMNF